MDLIIGIFDAKVLRRYDMPDETIMHAEMKIHDSVIMLGNASEKYPAITLQMHVYASNVEEIFDKAIGLGCEVVDLSHQRDGDPDRRRTFKDMAGNTWSIGTQMS